MRVLGIPNIPRRDKRRISFPVCFTASFKLFLALEFKKLTSPHNNCFEIRLCGTLNTHTSVRRRELGGSYKQSGTCYLLVWRVAWGSASCITVRSS